MKNNSTMKTIKLLAGALTLAAICACGNTKPNPQPQAQVSAPCIEAAKEQGTIFHDITLEKALEKAKAENKYVFINFHTSACGPCRKMKQEVFPTTECGEYINKHFVPILIDGEDEGAGTELAHKYQVFIFPTYLILTPDGFKEGEISGAEYDVKKFLDMLKTIIHDVQ